MPGGCITSKGMTFPNHFFFFSPRQEEKNRGKPRGPCLWPRQTCGGQAFEEGGYIILPHLMEKRKKQKQKRREKKGEKKEKKYTHAEPIYYLFLFLFSCFSF